MPTTSFQHVTKRRREVKTAMLLSLEPWLPVEIMTHASMQHMGTPDPRSCCTSLLVAPGMHGHGISKKKLHAGQQLMESLGP